MLIIRKNEVNNLIATVSMNKTLSNPYYLFSFQHIASKDRVSFLPQVITSNCRYDKFRFTESTTTNLAQVPPVVNFPYLGQYYYSIYEQVTSGNTNPALAFNKLESGRAVVIVGNDTPDECFFEPYISNDEDFANIIYVSEQEQECINVVSCCISNDLVGLSGSSPQITIIDGLEGSNYIAARRQPAYFRYNSQEYLYLMRVTETGEYDNSFNVSSLPLFTGNVDSYRVNDEKVAFSLRGSAPNGGLYLLDKNGSFLQSLTNFSHITTILATAAFQLLSDNSIIVLGSFSGYNSTNLYGVAKFDSNGNLDPTSASNGFSDLASLTTSMDNANLLLDNNGKLLVIINSNTSLNTYNGNPVRSIFRLNPDLSYDSTFDISTSAVIVTGVGLYLPNASFTNDDKIIVNWNLPSYSGHPSPSVVILNNDGSVFTDFTCPIPLTSPDNVNGTLVEDDKFYIFGNFTNYSGSGNNSIVKVDFSGNVDTTFVSQASAGALITGMHKLDDGNYLILRFSGSYAGYVDDVIKIDRYGNTIMCDVAPILTPTPTPTITSTPTLTPTLTNTPTLTSTPTNTPTLTSTPTNTLTSTPTNTPTLTNTPTSTTTSTPTPTCSSTIQYLDSVVVDGDKIRLSLWTDAAYTNPTVALCDYVVSGTMVGSSGTTYSSDRIFPTGDHQIQFNFTSFLQPGEVIVYHTVNSVSTSACTCPVDVQFTFVPPTPTPTLTSTPTPTPTLSSTPTPTLTSTPTSTPTPTLTNTSSSTPTPTLTSTPTPTLTNTSTSTPTPTPTLTMTPTSSTAGFSPSSVPDLIGWWKADAGVSVNGSNEVTSWADQVSIMGDLTLNTGSLAPYFSSGFGTNNMPYVRSNGTTVRYNSANSVDASATTVYIIGQIDTAIGGVYAGYLEWGAYGSGFIMLDTDGGATLGMSVGMTTDLTSTITPSLSTPFCIRNRWSGNTSNLIKLNNNTEINTGSALSSPKPSPASPLSLFNRSNTILGIDWKVAEILIYNRVLDSTELANLDNYITTKYGITL